jgi:hypothetical protein
MSPPFLFKARSYLLQFQKRRLALRKFVGNVYFEKRLFRGGPRLQVSLPGVVTSWATPYVGVSLAMVMSRNNRLSKVAG